MHFMLQETSTVFQQLRAVGTVLALGCVCTLTLLVAAPSRAAPRQLAAQADDVALEFKMLAQQRPWTCLEQEDSDPPRTAGVGGVAQCTWQNRLRMRRWGGVDGPIQGACVSTQAQWWTWARATSTPVMGGQAAWRTSWASHSIVDERGLKKRIVILQRMPDSTWNITEWRWHPSPRAATRRWQESRWKLLAARAHQLRAPGEAEQGPAEARMLRAVLEANLGTRVGEIGSNGWRWQTDALCLSVDGAGLGQQIMQLPYAVDDSRLEQRAAMQLQLARRYPKASWLTAFTLLPAAAHARGGAKFFAIWREHATLKGQLWIPTKGDGPLVRLRITTALPVAAGGQPDQQAIGRAAQVVQGELRGLASRWAIAYE